MTAPAPHRCRLHGIPCGVCGLPATGMEWAGGWRRIWHVAGWSCDVGTVPVDLIDKSKGGK